MTTFLLGPHMMEWNKGSSGPFLFLCCAVFSHSVMPDSLVHGDFQGKNTGVGCHAFLWGIFPTQILNPSLPHCRHILYCLSCQESPRILEWVAYPFSRGSSQGRDWTGIFCFDKDTNPSMGAPPSWPQLNLSSSQSLHLQNLQIRG